MSLLKTIDLKDLEQAIHSQLWNIFLEGQAQLFFESEYKWISQQHSWLKAKNVLEMGSGNGAYLSQLASQHPNKVFKGIEKLEEFTNQANQQYARSNVAFQIGDAEVFDNRFSNSADIVLFRLTLQHLQDPIIALKNAHNYLSSGGCVLIIDACDKARKSSHQINSNDEAIKLVAEIQLKAGKGNRRVTLELLEALETKKLPLNELYEVVSSNLDASGNVLRDNIMFLENQNRTLYFNHNLLFLALLQRTYNLPIDLSKAYDELQVYLSDEKAWFSAGMHFLVLKKRSQS